VNTERFIDDLLPILTATYVSALDRFQGNAVSYAFSEMKMKGWKNLGNLGDFESLCESIGFSVKSGQLDNGGRLCRPARVLTV
jgi:hypothetical protein